MDRRREAPFIFKRMKKLKLTKASEENSTKVDLISELSDEILSSILSLLSMKDEVKTSILSTRWRYIWASRLNLEFEFHTMLGRSIPEELITNEEDLAVFSSQYVRRVGNFLQFYRAPKIYSFKVSCCIDLKSPCYLDRWIEFAIAMGVEVLEINLSAKPYLHYDSDSWYMHYNFPCLLLPGDEKTSSLKYLHLEHCILACPLNFNGFNTLVTLALQEAVGPCVNLKCLEVSGCLEGSGHLAQMEILISAAKLESFKFCGNVKKLSLQNVPQLKRLFIHSRKSSPHLSSIVSQLPKDLPALESLFLSLTKDNSLPAKITSFSNLRQLELQIPAVDSWWIMSIINAAPLLSKLILNLQMSSDWTKKKSMRAYRCPNYHLKEIQIHGFRPRIEMELVIGLLEHCLALERMIIDTRCSFYTIDGGLHISKVDFFVFRKHKISMYEHEGGKEKFYEVLDREVPGKAGLVTIHL